jgi:hypothetical protein
LPCCTLRVSLPHWAWTKLNSIDAAQREISRRPNCRCAVVTEVRSLPWACVAERGDAMQDEGFAANILAIGTIFCAALMLVMGGIFQAIEGFVAIIQGGFFGTPPDYAFRMGAANWGWVHLALGLLLVVAGCGLFTGKLWARIVGIVAAVLGAIANFAFIPYYPIWSLLIIAVDVLAIWALALHGRDLAEMAGLES